MPITLDGTTGITAPAIDVATPVTTVDGGTGLSSFTSGGAMYATSTSALTTGTLPVASGGTGATSLTANNVVIGNGTSAVQLVAPGSSGNVLTSNGTTWTSAAAAGGQLRTQIFTSPGTWTNPGTVTQARVTVVGGGGSASPTANGGSGGYQIAQLTIPTSPVSVTIGAGASGTFGVGGSPGGTSSFGAFATATGGGGGGVPSPAGAPGSGSTTGTAILSGAMTQSPTGSTLIVGFVAGLTIRGSPNAGGTYSPSGPFIAGAQGGTNAGGGMGGVVIVEFVG